MLLLIAMLFRHNTMNFLHKNLSFKYLEWNKNLIDSAIKSILVKILNNNKSILNRSIKLKFYYMYLHDCLHKTLTLNTYHY